MSQASKLYQFLHNAGRAPVIHAPHGAIQVGERRIYYKCGLLFKKWKGLWIAVPLWWAKKHLDYDHRTSDTEQEKFLAARRAERAVVGAEGDRGHEIGTARN